MVDEVVIRSGYSLPVGGDRWEIRDSGKPVAFVDLLSEARHNNGVVYLSLASGVMDSGNPAAAQIETRLRMSLTTAQFLHKMLGNIINDALKPVDKTQAN